MAVRSLLWDVVAVFSRRTPAFQPLAAEPSTVAGNLLARWTGGAHAGHGLVGVSAVGGRRGPAEPEQQAARSGGHATLALDASDLPSGEWDMVDFGVPARSRGERRTPPRRLAGIGVPAASRTWVGHAAALLVVLVGLGVLAAVDLTGAAPAKPANGAWCELSRVAPDEVVGVSDASPGCELATGSSPSATALRELEQVVHRQNAAVATASSYVTVAFLGALTDTASPSATPSGLQALRGAVVAQQQANSRATSPGQSRVRLLIGNAGTAFAHGSTVARAIIARATTDRIVGVVGISMNQAASLQTVNVLTMAGIPLIGTSSLGNLLAESDVPPGYVQLSPSTTTIAATMATFVRNSPTLRGAAGAPADGPPLRTFVLVDQADIDGTPLIQDLTSGFGESARPIPLLPGRLDAAVMDVCALARPTPSAVLFLGPATELAELTHALTATCGGQAIPVLTANDPAAVPGGAATLARQTPSPSVFYVNADTPAGDSLAATGYADLFHQDMDGTAVMGYDALSLLAQVAQALGGDTSAHAPLPRDVSRYLASSGLNLSGTVGRTQLDGGDRYPVDASIVVRHAAQDGSLHTDLACGAQHTGQAPATRWGPHGDDYPCPTAAH
jgi:ABC-type branched-subunit amino acid transport system substrate-binding protein